MSEQNSNIGTQEGSESSSSSISVMQTVITPFDISELTNENGKGNGVFDILVSTLKSHLIEEFGKGRITGPEYATVYSEFLVAALGQSIDYVSRRATLGYQIQGMENDNAYKMAQIEIAREQLKKIPAEIAAIEAGTRQTELITTSRIPAEVANLAKQGEVIDQQILESTFRVEQVMPKELERITADIVNTGLQGENIRAQTERLTIETTTRLPVEVANLTKQGAVLEQQVAESVYRVANVLPKELEQLDAQVVNLGKQGELITQQVAESTYRVANVLPKELEQITAQISNMGKQGELLTQQVAESAYRVENILPLEVTKTEAMVASTEAEVALTSARTQTEIASQARIPVEVELLRKNSLKADADILLAEKSVERMTAELTKIPLEKAILTKQADQITAQISQVESSILKTNYEVEFILPVEKDNAIKQGTQIAAQTQLTTEQKELTKAQATTFPVEIDYKRAQIANMGRQSIILEREAAIKENELLLQAKQIEIAAVQLDVQREELEVKRAQVAGQQAQSDLYRQKVITEKAQTDKSVVGVGSVIDLNNKVLEGQVGAYRFDAQNRTAKLLLDTFVTTYQGGDREVNSTNKLTDVDIGKVMGVMYQSIGAAN